MKIVCYWYKNRHKDQWNRIEDPDLNPYSYAHVIFKKSVQNIRWRKDTSSINVAGKAVYLHAEN
jgi:hypothetical protein